MVIPPCHRASSARRRCPVPAMFDQGQEVAAARPALRAAALSAQLWQAMRLDHGRLRPALAEAAVLDGELSAPPPPCPPVAPPHRTRKWTVHCLVPFGKGAFCLRCSKGGFAAGSAARVGPTPCAGRSAPSPALQLALRRGGGDSFFLAAPVSVRALASKQGWVPLVRTAVASSASSAHAAPAHAAHAGHAEAPDLAPVLAAPRLSAGPGRVPTEFGKRPPPAVLPADASEPGCKRLRGGSGRSGPSNPPVLLAGGRPGPPLLRRDPGPCPPDPPQVRQVGPRPSLAPPPGWKLRWGVATPKAWLRSAAALRPRPCTPASCSPATPLRREGVAPPPLEFAPAGRDPPAPCTPSVQSFAAQAPPPPPPPPARASPKVARPCPPRPHAPPQGWRFRWGVATPKAWLHHPAARACTGPGCGQVPDLSTPPAPGVRDGPGGVSRPGPSPAPGAAHGESRAPSPAPSDRAPSLHAPCAHPLVRRDGYAGPALPREERPPGGGRPPLGDLPACAAVALARAGPSGAPGTCVTRTSSGERQRSPPAPRGCRPLRGPLRPLLLARASALSRRETLRLPRALARLSRARCCRPLRTPTAPARSSVRVLSPLPFGLPASSVGSGGGRGGRSRCASPTAPPPCPPWVLLLLAPRP